MTHPSEPFDQREADTLAAFGDALVEGRQPSPANEIERAMVRAFKATSRGDDREMPADRKRQIREDLMTSTATLIDRVATAPGGATPSARVRPLLPAATHRGWQALASFALVLAVLAALVTLAWQEGTGSGPSDQEPTLSAQALFDPNDPSTFPRVPEKCIPNGEVPSDEALVNRSIDDWPAPEYAPAKAVSYEKGKAIQDTYMHYIRCEWQAFDQAYPPGSTPPVGAGTPVPPLEASPTMRTYFSDRLLYDHMYSSLTAEHRAALDAYRCEPRVARLLETFPLPVNQPKDYAVKSLLANGDIDEVAQVFNPSDVYLMPDGRYGVVMGSVTTAGLTDPSAVTQEDWLTFIAFTEVDGRYHIDEIFTLLAPDMDRLFPDGHNGTILMNCD